MEEEVPMSMKMHRDVWFNTADTSLLRWFILNNLSADECVAINKTAQITPISPKENEVIDTVDLTINGVSIPLKEAFQALQEHMEERIEREATCLFLKRIRGSNAIQRMTDVLERFSQEMEGTLAADFGFKMDKEGIY